MKIRVARGRIKAQGQYHGVDAVVHVDDETGKDLVERGIAERVRRSTKVRLQPQSLETQAEQVEGEK